MSKVAELLIESARAQADAARQRGAIWGNALGNIGQSVAAIPGQMQQQKRQDALMLLEQARDARARGEEDRARTLFAQSQREYENDKAIHAVLFADPAHLDFKGAYAKAIELNADPAKIVDLEQRLKPKPIQVPAGGSLVDPTTFKPTFTAPPIPRQPTEASLAQTAAGGDAQAKAALDLLKQQKNPPSMDEQLLTAIANGDTAGASRIKRTMQEAATAKRDPAAASLANELGNLRADEARQRLATMKADAEPLDIEADIQTTAAGRKYIDLSLYQGKERNRARTAAGVAGATAVSKEQANALQEIDNARANQKSINDQIQDLLPRGVGGRILSVPTVKLEKLFQTDERIAAFNSWRTAAIQTLRATAGSKGLRINQAEIAQAIENDIPKLTDTLGTAQQKLKNIETMLENAEQSILVRDRTVTPPPESKAPTLSPGLDALRKR